VGDWSRLRKGTVIKKKGYGQPRAKKEGDQTLIKHAKGKGLGSNGKTRAIERGWKTNAIGIGAKDEESPSLGVGNHNKKIIFALQKDPTCG